jgi:hypothetical protein
MIPQKSYPLPLSKKPANIPLAGPYTTCSTHLEINLTNLLKTTTFTVKLCDSPLKNLIIP